MEGRRAGGCARLFGGERLLRCSLNDTVFLLCPAVRGPGFAPCSALRNQAIGCHDLAMPYLRGQWPLGGIPIQIPPALWLCCSRHSPGAAGCWCQSSIFVVPQQPVNGLNQIFCYFAILCFSSHLSISLPKYSNTTSHQRFAELQRSVVNSLHCPDAAGATSPWGHGSKAFSGTQGPCL